MLSAWACHFNMFQKLKTQRRPSCVCEILVNVSKRYVELISVPKIIHKQYVESWMYIQWFTYIRMLYYYYYYSPLLGTAVARQINDLA